jgi:hypothetical protein
MKQNQLVALAIELVEVLHKHGATDNDARTVFEIASQLKAAEYFEITLEERMLGKK